MNAYQHEIGGKKWKDVYNFNPVRVRQGLTRKAKGYSPKRVRSVAHVGMTGPRVEK